MGKKKPRAFSVPRYDALLIPELVLLEASSRPKNPNWRRDSSTKLIAYL